MTRLHRSRIFAGTFAAFALASAGCTQNAASSEPAVPDTPQMKQLQSAGKEASIAILPTVLAGKPMKQVGEVIAMMLERGGMTNLQLVDAEFQPPKDADITKASEAFAEFIKRQPLDTDYALFTEVVASPQRKVLEVRTIVVDKEGAIAWVDSQRPDDADFKHIKPTEPMQCCLLSSERLKPVLSLSDPKNGSAPAGRLAKKWAEDTGLPDKAEQAAMAERLKTLKKTAAHSTLWVYPPRVGDELSVPGAASLVKSISMTGLTKAVAAASVEKLAVQPSMNEQKMLWVMAAAFRKQIRKAPPDADYVLYAEYMMNKGGVGAVHFAVCDRQGEWVLVDFQNSHQKDFLSNKPQTREDCDRLVAKRLEGYCR